jgi:hypothetical protein
MELTRIMHILNIDGNGKEVFLVNGMEPEDEDIKGLALMKIVDYEFHAAGKPFGWSGKLKDMYYESGFLFNQGRNIPYSYCSVKPSEQAHQDLLSDISKLGYSFLATEQSEGKTTIKHTQTIIIGICIAIIVIIGIIVLIICK